MKKEDEQLGEQLDDEDLLNFDLDDISPEDLDQESAEEESEQEIIELVDRVEKGEQEKNKNCTPGL